MVQNNNPYEKLVDYYSVQENTKKTSRKNEKIEPKKILDPSSFHSYTPPGVLNKQVNHTSLGFDVDKFESIMRSKLVDDHKKRQSYERNYISVSELYTCMRQCYYLRMKYDDDLSKRYQFSYLHLIQKVGDVIHATILDLYGFSETEKTIISEKYKVKGRADGIKDNFLYDIKSIDEGKFKNKYIEEHYYQGLIYAYILNTEYNYQINTITIIYVMRNLKKISAFDIPVDNKLAVTFLQRALKLKKALSTNTVIDPIGATNESCRYCTFKIQCKKDAFIEVSQPFSIQDLKPKKNENKEIKEENRKAFLL